jgi:hypothetical protein
MPEPQEHDEQRIDGVYVQHYARISLVMREHYPKVLAANRFFEEETGIHNEIGSNNLNDALSHLGTLMESAADMSFEQQANEVHDFEGHLRRGMMESYEQVFRLRMGEVQKKWHHHLRVARPLIESGRLPGVPTGQQLDVLRRRCKNLLEDGRAAKRGHDWAEWDEGTEALAVACRTASELYTALDQGIAAAEQRKSDRRVFRFGVVVTVLVAAVCIPLGWWFNDLLSSPSTARVPDVVGATITTAVIDLSDHELRAGVHPLPPKDKTCLVVSETPGPDTIRNVGSTVTLSWSCSRP